MVTYLSASIYIIASSTVIDSDTYDLAGKTEGTDYIKIPIDRNYIVKCGVPFDSTVGQKFQDLVGGTTINLSMGAVHDEVSITLLETSITQVNYIKSFVGAHYKSSQTQTYLVIVLVAPTGNGTGTFEEFYDYPNATRRQYLPGWIQLPVVISKAEEDGPTYDPIQILFRSGWS